MPVFKSSKFSIWPLYFVINELPISKQWLDENVVLAGLWFGIEKPKMLTFIQPFCEKSCQFTCWCWTVFSRHWQNFSVSSHALVWNLRPGSSAAYIYQQLTSLRVGVRDASLYKDASCICVALDEGKDRSCIQNSSHQQALQRATKCETLRVFSRAVVGGTRTIHSKAHTLPKKRNSYIVSYVNSYQSYHGEILYFV